LEKINSVTNRKEIISSRLSIYYSNGSNDVSSFAEDVKSGLTASKKYLLPKYNA
jgi:hypothetical protein